MTWRIIQYRVHKQETRKRHPISAPKIDVVLAAVVSGPYIRRLKINILQNIINENRLQYIKNLLKGNLQT